MKSERKNLRLADKNMGETAMPPESMGRCGDVRPRVSTVRKHGMTMVEILIAVAIVLILATGFFIVSGKAKTQSDAALVRETLTAMDTALQEYYDFTHTYPPDVNYAGTGNSRSLKDALHLSGYPMPGDPCVVPPTAGYQIDPQAESIEVLYYYLNRVPQSRRILDDLSTAAVTSRAVRLDASGKPVASQIADPNLLITINGQNVSLFRVVDVWNMPLEYLRVRQSPYTTENTNFPLIRSAGPDKVFGTADDIVNKKN
jgi:prepilin-type N-terminal cleavage/methylation domain-containing protein